MSRPIQSTYGYAAVNPGTPRSDPWIIIGSVSRTASDARTWVGSMYAGSRPWQEGWKLAKKNGIRVIRVNIEPAFADRGERD